MSKKLSEMTLRELWQLFPIILEPHHDRFISYYREISACLKERLADFSVRRISHIGSTAVMGIWAKPIVDILVEIEPDENMTVVSGRLCEIGFHQMSASENRVSFNLGYTENGFAEKVYHLHLRYRGDNDELYFRDYLNEFPEVAAEYERLKRSLWHKYEHNRDAYTDAKTDFIRLYTEKAKKLYADRYCV